MRYELMLPYQIRKAIDENWPVILPLGVLEYHAEHLGVGMDTFAVTKVVERLEKEMDMVVLPPFYYGAASSAVAAQERNGSVHVDCYELMPFATGLFRSLLKIGFRNVHGIIHHQSENFTQGMPTDLAFKTAARKVIFDFLEKERGDGWWGDEAMSDYYAQHSEGSDPFSWITFHPLMDKTIIEAYDFDHAGIGETSLMMALCPESVDMSHFDESKWFCRTAKDATAEYGEKAVSMIMDRFREILQ